MGTLRSFFFPAKYTRNRGRTTVAPLCAPGLVKNTDFKAQSRAMDATKPAVPSANDEQLKDDIKAEEWLKEIGRGEYAETFELNFAYGGRYLSRKRLAQVKLTSFPHMGIQDFQHAKEILEHIRHTLNFPFINQQRIQEVKERMRQKRAREGGDEYDEKDEEEEEEEGGAAAAAGQGAENAS